MRPSRAEAFGLRCEPGMVAVAALFPERPAAWPPRARRRHMARGCACSPDGAEVRAGRSSPAEKQEPAGFDASGSLGLLALPGRPLGALCILLVLDLERAVWSIAFRRHRSKANPSAPHAADASVRYACAHLARRPGRGRSLADPNLHPAPAWRCSVQDRSQYRRSLGSDHELLRRAARVQSNSPTARYRDEQ
jgi:hypothetical protein